MAEEGNLSHEDARREEIAPPMEHGAPEEILPVDNGTKNNTPHFQFTSF